MEKSLQELLIKYVDDNKYADFEYVKSVLNILISKYGDNGLRNFEVISLEKNGCSDFSNSTIFIALDFIKSNLLKKNYYYDIKSNLYLVNLYVMLVLMHEFNHFRQTKKINLVIDSEEFLDKLFVNSYIFLCSNDVDMINKYNNTNYKDLFEVEEFYNEYHDCFVIERLAQIEAYKMLINVIEPISSLIGKVYYFFINSYYAYKIREYYLMDDGILSPIDLLLSNIISDDVCLDSNNMKDSQFSNESEDFYEELISVYSVNERTCYGLPITELEYYNIVSFINLMYVLSGNCGISISNKMGKKRVKDIDK